MPLVPHQRMVPLTLLLRRVLQVAGLAAEVAGAAAGAGAAGAADAAGPGAAARRMQPGTSLRPWLRWPFKSMVGNKWAGQAFRHWERLVQ